MNWKKSKDAAAKADPGAEKAAPGAGGPAAFVKKNWKWLVPVVCVVALGGWFILRPSPAQNTNADINYVQTTPEKRDLSNSLSGTGTLNPANTYTVKSLVDGKILTGKTSELLGCSSALLLNALKHMAGIDHKLDLIPSSVIEPISAMKTDYLGHRNPRLHSDEVLIALAISGLTNPLADMVQAQLKNLRGCDAHFSVIISEEDAKLYKRLGINVSCEPKYEIKSLYHK